MAAGRRAEGPGRASGLDVTIRIIGSSGAAVSRNLNSVIVLKKGLTVTGRVVDAAGRPVKGARALFGHDTWGRLVRRQRRRTSKASSSWRTATAGPSIITVQAEGFAPQIEDVRVEERTAPVEFRTDRARLDPAREGR